MKNLAPRLQRRRARAQGLVLIVALILMAVIAVTSAAAIRSVTSGDMIGSNLRNANLSQQAGEAALRWCESQVLNDATTPSVVPILPVVPEGMESWRTIANWANATVIPNAVLNNTLTGTNRYTTFPRCLAQAVQLRPALDDANLQIANQTIRVVQVTVRAFSPDYNRNASGIGTGSEVWLQSTLYIPPNF